jgi:hypothetical protein
MIITNKTHKLLTDIVCEPHHAPIKKLLKGLEESKKADFIVCESQMDADFNNFIQKALALWERQKKGHNGDKHKTFQRYCAQRWGMNPQFVKKLTEGAEAGKYHISTLFEERGDVLPIGVHQMVALLQAGDDKANLLKVSKKAVNRAKTSPVTPQGVDQTMEEAKSNAKPANGGPKKPAGKEDQQPRAAFPKLNEVLQVIKAARRDVKKMSPAAMRKCLDQIETGIDEYLTDLTS